MTNILIFILLCLIWGSTWLAIKIGLDGAPPFLSAGIRFIVAAAALYFFTAISGRWNFSFLRRWRIVFLAGLFLYPLPYGLVYWGEQYVESGMSSVLFAIFPFFVAILAHLMIRDERLTVLKTTGMIIGFSGLIIIFAENMGAKGEWGIIGMAAIALSPLFSAIGTILMKKYFHEDDPVPLTAIHTSLAAIVLTLVGIFSERSATFNLDKYTIGSVAYLAIFGTAVAFSLYFYLLKKVEATKLSMIAFITPVVALILGVVFRSEYLELSSILGSFMVIAGVFTVVTGDNLWRRYRAGR